MRAYIIAGGIYSLMVVRRPDQTTYQNLSVILHEDERKIKNLADVVCRTDFKGQSVSLRVSDFARADSRNSLFKLDESDLPYFHVTMKLPPDLCRWGTPRVCQFLSNTHKNITKRKRSTVHLSYFDFKRVSSRCSYFTNNSTNSRMSLLANAFAPPLMSVLRSSRMSLPVDRAYRRKDFELNKTLSKIEVMSLKNACLPRIISSFKMPRDFLDGKDVDSQVRSHALVKRFDVTDTVEEAPRLDNFEFEVQEDPERVFPYFETQFNELYDSGGSETDQLDNTKKTANRLVSTFDSIMLQYMTKPNAILRQIDPQKKGQKKGAVEEQSVVEELNYDDKQSLKRKSTRKSAKDTGEPVAKAAKKPDTNKRAISLNVPSRLSLRASEISFRAESRDNLQARKSRSSKKKLKGANSALLGQGNDDDEDDYEYTTETVQQWSTKYIKDFKINTEDNTISFKTDRLGVFGFSFKRYEHFPFRDWVLQPNEEK